MKLLRLLALAAYAVTRVDVADAAAPVVLENPLFRWTISADAKNTEFEDRATRTEYLRKTEPCAEIRMSARSYGATAATLANERLTLSFGESGFTAVLKVEPRPSCIVLTVESVAGGAVESLTFLNVPLTVKGAPDEPFGACALALNLITRVDALPALQRDLRASAERKHGIIGAKVAVVAAPLPRMLPALRETLSAFSELPVCKVAGPWAHEIPFNHGSYLFNFGSLTETNLDEWIEMTRALGFTQIDNHGGGGFFRFGDMELNRHKWPDGWETWQRIVSRLHAAGIGSIFHTYAFFIDKQSKYVAPVPDPRLDAFRTFTLAEPLSAEATEIVVNESTAEIKTVTGFFEHNSVVLHVGDELVTFSGASKERPWRFTGVKRGAHGTKAAAHARGAKARHLKECFGLFVPDVESSLFEEIAANHAEVVNRCDFDGIYLDAIDGSSILRGGDECWYWANKFVVEIQKRLKKPVGMEMSAMWHHFWQYRTRWQAWDYPQRGHRRFVDLHAAEVNGGLLLPLHLGWWGFQSFNPPQIEPTYPDVIENLGARLIGWDAGISLTAGVDRNALRNTPLFQRAVGVLRVCEDLRRGQAFSAATKAKLREPGKEFALFNDAAGKSRFHRVESLPHSAALAEPWTLSWRVTNTFAAQPLRFRLEALMSAQSTPATYQVVLADFATDVPGWKRASAAGVSFRLEAGTGPQRDEVILVATNSGTVQRKAAWLRLMKTCEPLLDLRQHQALQLEAEGDGSGAVLAIRLESPHHLAFGAVADRYLPLDFTGRRAVTLIETESARWSDYVWDDGKGLYNVYRETINFGAVESVSVYLQNLSPGRETRVRLGPIRAVAMRTGMVRNPRITIGGKTVELPVELASGSWIEGNAPGECAVYGSKGEPLGTVTPRGDWPQLQRGVSTAEFSCETGDGPQPRARVTLFSHGEPVD